MEARLIARANRDVAAIVLRQLADGEITNEEFMKKFPSGCDEDPALQAVFMFAWGQFSDHRVYALTGSAAPLPERLAIFERCYSFLKSDFEFEWPVSKPMAGKVLLGIITLGRAFRGFDEEYKSKGDFEVWPFLRAIDCEAARSKA
jgi:hypothetical protein